MKTLRNLALVAAPTAMLAAAPAFAQNGADYSTLTSAVDFGTVITALMAVAAVLVTVLIARKGIRFVLGAIK